MERKAELSRSSVKSVSVKKIAGKAAKAFLSKMFNLGLKTSIVVIAAAMGITFLNMMTIANSVLNISAMILILVASISYFRYAFSMYSTKKAFIKGEANHIVILMAIYLLALSHLISPEHQIGMQNIVIGAIIISLFDFKSDKEEKVQ